VCASFNKHALVTEIKQTTQMAALFSPQHIGARQFASNIASKKCTRHWLSKVKAADKLVGWPWPLENSTGNTA
jgi:hypothetical protein